MNKERLAGGTGDAVGTEDTSRRSTMSKMSKAQTTSLMDAGIDWQPLSVSRRGYRRFRLSFRGTVIADTIFSGSILQFVRGWDARGNCRMTSGGKDSSS